MREAPLVMVLLLVGIAGADTRAPAGKVVGPGVNAKAPACPDGTVHVPGGEFAMGDASDGPAHAVKLAGFCIDRTEVTVGAYARCVAAKTCASPGPLPDKVNWASDKLTFWKKLCNGGREDRRDHPMNCVDWGQAKAYCAWAHERLPTEAEWEHAARGSDGRTYPWGNDTPTAKRLNACGAECQAAMKRGEFHGGKLYAEDDGWPTTAPVGKAPAGASPFGALDMAGNVAEWTADWFDNYGAEPASNPSGPGSGTSRVHRGGSWLSREANAVRAARRDQDEPSFRDIDVGFRCATAE